MVQSKERDLLYYHCYLFFNTRYFESRSLGYDMGLKEKLVLQ